jgi:4-nitrophenyl phosphatase
MKKIKSLIFDMDGVLWKDENPLVDLEHVFKTINDHKINYAFATNNSTKTPEEYHQKLLKLGIPNDPDQIITSSIVVLAQMLKKFPDGGPVFILGENGLVEPLLQAGFYHNEESVLAVVGGMDRQVNYDKFKKAILFLQKDVEFFFTNSDTTFPTPQGKIPGAGSILRTLEVGSGRNAIIAGKPKPAMFEKALEILNSSPENTLVIGDRLETDILGGLNAQCLTALVLSGISKKSEIDEKNIHPHLINNNIEELVEFLEKNMWTIN